MSDPISNLTGAILALAIATLTIAYIIFLSIKTLAHLAASRRLTWINTGAISLSLIGAPVFAWSAIHGALSGFRVALFAFITLGATRLFAKAIEAETNSPTATFPTNGPYRFTRHPLYAAHLLFWTGAAIAAPTAIMIAVTVAFASLYAAVSIHEERQFAQTPHADAYASYQKTAGLLWPKWNRSISNKS